MWRALAVMVFVLLGSGVYVIVTGGAAAHAAAPPDASGPGTTDFGFALVAGCVALLAAVLLTRPRFPRRR